MSAPLAPSTISPHAIAAQLPPRQRGALVELVAGRQPGIRAAGLEQRGLVEHDVAADVLTLTAMGRLVAQVLDGAS
jgi:hypothetical protein